MADSSSVHDTSVRQPLLTFKPQQNLIIDLTPFIYEPYMLYVVECLKYSPLVDALTKVEVVPMSCLSIVYSTAFYDKINEWIHFELHDEKTSISKTRFCALIGLSQDPSLGISKRSAGSDGASNSFMTVLYGLYNGLNLDFGSIIWQQLVQSLVSSSRNSEISCGRFWSLINNWAMDRLRVPIMADSLLSSIATFHTTKIIVADPTKFSFIGSIPEAMLGRISASRSVHLLAHESLHRLCFVPLKRLKSQPRGVKSLKHRKRDWSLNPPRGKPPRSENMIKLLLLRLNRKSRRSPLGGLFFNPPVIRIQNVSLQSRRTLLVQNLRAKALMNRLRAEVTLRFAPLLQKFRFALLLLHLHLLQSLSLSLLSLQLPPLNPSLQFLFPLLFSQIQLMGFSHKNFPMCACKTLMLGSRLSNKHALSPRLLIAN
uniref:Uncharacterized protein n=1 Tax=Lactuca sativa TaxID=4236 RepID=A0A9R1V2D2_LACSA|nr:hypothetical protein LSAT_V11C700366830 [Lactuca sativa]